MALALLPPPRDNPDLQKYLGQFYYSWAGIPGRGIPLLQTGVNDDTRYAVDANNAGSGRLALRAVAGSNSLTVTNAGVAISGASIAGNLSVGGTLTVTGTSTLGTVNAGAVSATSLGVSGSSTLAGVSAISLSVSGTSTLGTVNAGALSGTSLNVSGTSTLGVLNAGATSTTTLSASSTLNVTGTSTLGVVNAGAVSGTTGTFSGAISGTTITGSSTVQGTQLVSTITTGTAPLIVNSTTQVANLNVNFLQGNAASAFAVAAHTSSGDHDSRYVNVNGDTMTSGLTISAGGLTVSSGGMNITGTSTLAATTCTTLQASSTATLQGSLTHTGSTIGFFNHATSGQQTVFGTRTGTLAQLQSVVQTICAAGAAYGLWADTTT